MLIMEEFSLDGKIVTVTDDVYNEKYYRNIYKTKNIPKFICFPIAQLLGQIKFYNFLDRVVND